MFVNMYISYILMRNTGSSNSKTWLEPGFTDYLNQKTEKREPSYTVGGNAN